MYPTIPLEHVPDELLVEFGMRVEHLAAASTALPRTNSLSKDNG